MYVPAGNFDNWSLLGQLEKRLGRTNLAPPTAAAPDNPGRGAYVCRSTLQVACEEVWLCALIEAKASWHLGQRLWAAGC